MIDVKIIWDNENSVGDFSITDADFTKESGLETAVYISLFTDQRANSDDPIDDVNDKRGWWGDTLETDGDKIGSKLWQLYRQKITTEVLAKIKEYIEDCLQWMIDDGVVADVEAIVERNSLDRVYTEIKLYRQSGSTTTIAFDDLWVAQGGE
jgi:phage gp46-like protein